MLYNKEHKMSDTYSQFERGTLAIGGKQIELGALPWKAHPKFAGVFLKDVLDTGQTGGRLSCHLVRIEPGHVIGRHVHVDSIELHETIKGSGVCLTPNGEIAYRPGVMGVLMPKEAHEVHAGEEGLYLFAKFIPVPV
jgi:quercetin dioxygenase-like cupin family protein